MPEVGNIFPKNAPEQLNKMTQGLNNTNDATNKLLETTRQLSDLLKESNITFVKLSEAQKKAEGVSKGLNTVEQQLFKTEQQLKQLGDERQKQIAANQIAAQKKRKDLKDTARLEAANTKEVKQNIIVVKAQNGAYNAITAALTKNIAKWKALPKHLRENTKEGRNLEAAIVRDEKALKKLDSQIGRSQRHVGNYKQALKGVATSLLGAFGVVGGVAMFARVMKDAFSTLRSFTKENAVLAGVLGKTRDEITELTNQAVQLGSVYPITASEVVKLQVSFARLGFTMGEIQNLTEATIQGSIALNSELDATATLVGAVVKAYASLGTTDAAKIIDQLTIATQRSSLSFSSLETALPKVAAAASALNVPLSKTLSLLSIAQDATLDASVSGTSLRNIFLEISKEGITLEEALDRINNSSNRLSAAYDLFGKRGAIVGLALADNKEKAIELTAEYENVGNVAETVAKEQMATLDGSIKSLGSSWEKLILGFRESEGVLSGVTNFFTNILDGITNANAAVGPTAGIFWATLFGLDDKVRKESKARTDEFHKITLTELRKLLQAQQDLRQEARKEDDDLAERSATNAVIRIHRRIEELEKLEKDAAARKALKRTEAEVAELEAAEKIAEERKKAEKKANKEIEAERERHRKELRKSNEKFVEDVRKTQRKGVFDEVKDKKEADEEFLKDNLDKLKERSKQASDTSSEILKREADDEETRKLIIDTGFEAAGMISDALSERKIANLQKEFDVLEMQKEAELAKENLTAEEKQKIEEKFAKQAAELKTKQAKAEKRGALASAIINTAKSVVSLGIITPAAILAGILGAVQIGIIAAQPIPEFAEGTKGKANTPSEFIAGEAGRELMTLRTGQVMMVDKPTHFKGNKYQGATINPNSETEKIMAQADRTNNIFFDTAELKSEGRRNTRQIVKAIARDKYNQNQAVSNSYKNKFL